MDSRYYTNAGEVWGRSKREHNIPDPAPAMDKARDPVKMYLEEAILRLRFGISGQAD